MRFQIGLKRKPPRGQWLSDLLGRNWWVFGQSLKKAPYARTAIFNQSFSVKSYLLFFFRQETTKKGMSTRHKHFTIQENVLHRYSGLWFIHESLSKISPFILVLFRFRNIQKTVAYLSRLKKSGFVNIVIIKQKVVHESFFKFAPSVPLSFNRHFFL